MTTSPKDLKLELILGTDHKYKLSKVKQQHIETLFFGFQSYKQHCSIMAESISSNKWFIYYSTASNLHKQLHKKLISDKKKYYSFTLELYELIVYKNMLDFYEPYQDAYGRAIIEIYKLKFGSCMPTFLNREQRDTENE